MGQQGLHLDHGDVRVGIRVTKYVQSTHRCWKNGKCQDEAYLWKGADVAQ